MLGEPVSETASTNQTVAQVDDADGWTFDPEAPAVRSLSIVGIAHGAADLARNAKDIVRRELGGQDRPVGRSTGRSVSSADGPAEIQ